MGTKYTLAGTQISIGTTAAIDFTSENTAKTSFAADDYTPIGGAAGLGDFGDTASDVTLNLLADARVQHLKGSVDGGTVQITVADDPTDAGQQAARAAAVPGNQNEYNFKIVYATGDIGYLRGPVTGFSRVNGSGPNNVAQRQITFSNNHGEVLALASSGTAPAFTAAPAITGTATVGQDLTATPGTVTGSPTPAVSYQWYRDGIAVSGATETTYTLTSDDEGATMTVEETAVNGLGSARSVSAATAAVTA